MTDLVTILNTSVAPSITYNPGRHPIIGWQNMLADTSATITPSSQASTALAVNALDGKEYTFWQTTAGGTQYLQVDFSIAKSINYFAIQGHNLPSVGGSYTVQYWDGSAWQALGTTVTPTTTSPSMITFGSITATRFRVLFYSSAALSIAVMYLGQYMQMERGCWNGLTPPWMGRNTVVTTTVSQNGVLLGRSVRHLGLRWSLSFNFITPAFIRSSWMPFIISAETNPFFVQWNPVDNPDEVAFAWIEDPSKDVTVPKYTSYAYMSCAVNCVGKS
jgi:F5/8 type C domain